MHEKEFDVNYWEDVWEHINIPQEITPENIQEIHRILSKILPKGNLRFIEIGCAPGGWLSYFHNQFHYSVSGIDYAPQACRKTIENLKHLNVPSKIFHIDFLEFESEPYDVVFSSGFIEHFKDVMAIIEKLANLCKSNGGILITIIPNMQGVSRWISKTFRPQVAAGHFPINKQNLIKYHERCGIQTLFSNYVGSLRIFPPIEKNAFSKKHPLISSALNRPFHAWNHLINNLTKRIGKYPELGFISESLIYIGKKR